MPLEIFPYNSNKFSLLGGFWPGRHAIRWLKTALVISEYRSLQIHTWLPFQVDSFAYLLRNLPAVNYDEHLSSGCFARRLLWYICGSRIGDLWICSTNPSIMWNMTDSVFRLPRRQSRYSNILIPWTISSFFHQELTVIPRCLGLARSRKGKVRSEIRTSGALDRRSTSLDLLKMFPLMALLISTNHSAQLTRLASQSPKKSCKLAMKPMQVLYSFYFDYAYVNE